MAEKDKGGQEATLAIIMFAGLIIGFFVIIWLIFHTQITQGILLLRQGEMALATHWIDEDNARLNHPATEEYGYMVRRHQGKLADPRSFTAWQEYIPNANPVIFKFKDFAPLSELALTPYKYIVSGIFLLFILHQFFIGVGSKGKRRFDRDGIIAEQAKNFPHITPFVEFNPNDMPQRAPGDPVPVELPSFSEPLGPEEWVAYHQVPMPDGKLDKDMARRGFEQQLGSRWKGPKQLKLHEQILLAGFILKAARKRNEADALLGRLACCWSYKKGLNVGQDPALKRDAYKVLRNKEMCTPTLNIMKQHAYTNPALMRALDFARSEGGILAPAQFVWMRGYDRTLWYVLNNVGKQAFHIEALGAMAHYVHEKRTNRPIPVPKVDEAVNSLNALLESDHARPIPELDYGKSSENKKRGGVLRPAGT